MTAEIRIAQAVREARARAGLNQTQLAERVGCNQSEISRIERGDRTLTVARLAALVEVLDLDAAALFGADEREAEDRTPEPA
jgi:transcriptional regulator with XRE-family HTH domain